MLKRLVDSYEQGQIIPKCRFSAKIFPHEADIPSLRGQIKLNGAKKPYNTVMFDIDPTTFTSGNTKSCIGIGYSFRLGLRLGFKDVNIFIGSGYMIITVWFCPPPFTLG